MQWIFGDDPHTQAIVACCTRLKTSTLFEDKTSALNELENLAKEHPLEVGVKAMATLCDEVLCKHFEEQLLIKKCIDILMLLLLPPEEPYDHSKLPRHPTLQRVYYEHNLELLLTPSSSSGEHMEVFIRLLRDEYAESIELQYNVVQILTMLLLYKQTTHKIRSELLSMHGAINTLSALLNSPHEFIRNAAVILLTHLSHNDASIQKLIAFDGAFEKVLHIINEEELGIEGGMVVQDCLALLDNLLTHNESNEKYFIEIGCVPHLQALLQPTDFGHSQQMAIVGRVLDIVMAIARHCGHLSNAQKAMAPLMHALLSIVAYFGYKPSLQPQQQQPQQQPQDINYALLQQKCLLLLRMIVYLHANNNMLLATDTSAVKLTYYSDKNVVESSAVSPLLLLTKLCLYGYKLTPSSAPLLFDPMLSLLSESVLRSLLCRNRKLQQILMNALLRRASQPHSSPNQQQQQPPPKWDTEFANVLFQILSVPQLSKGFGDPLKYWMATRLLSYLCADNNGVKMMALSSSSPLPAMMLSALRMTIDSNSNCDQRIQIGLLLLLATFCFECRDAIYALFTRSNECMQCLVQLATDDERGNAYTRGLATFIVALCLEFARDLNSNSNSDSNPQASNSHRNSTFSPFLFDVVNRQISLDRFRGNLDALRGTPEYQRMMSVVQTCAKKIPPSSSSSSDDESERHKRMQIEQMFAFEFDVANDACVAHEQNNRFKVHLFDRVFVQQYEAVFAVIDKRIIQMISSNRQSAAANGPSGAAAAVSVMKRVPPPSTTASVVAVEYEQKLQSLSQQNALLSAENARLKQQMTEQVRNRRNGDSDQNDRLNAAQTELQELRKQLRAQSEMILAQKQQLSDTTTKKNESVSSASSSSQEWSLKYNTLKATYEHLNRDHEELLVFVGHLHEQFEKTQKELRVLKLDKQKQNETATRTTHATETNSNASQSRNPYAAPDLM